jgi:ADP-dependent NAD(P)H-hydrate dehydratase / NAD(P)H-hydrate epimerase
MKSKILAGKRKRNTYKGDYGRVFILAGPTGLTGAAALCSMACMRSGAGMVTLGIPGSLNAIMEIKLTEVMTYPLAETISGTFSLKAGYEALKKINESDAALLGPGISLNKETRDFVIDIIPGIKRPLVLDADALNAIAANTDVLKKMKSGCVITPHPGEMARLIRKDTAYIEKNRLIVAKNFANHYNAVVVLKGNNTVVAGPGEKKSYVNKTGNPGMATAGSGDVLAGVIAGFLAQGCGIFEAAKLAVYTHGLAGDLAVKEKGEAGLIASDILEKLPSAIKLA